jgi:8-oxo-dGTP diphosphatase
VAPGGYREPVPDRHPVPRQDNAGAPAWHGSGLPTKRMAAGMLFCDPDGRVLFVQPTYKPQWEIPGGVVEADESPYAAAVREVAEEIGLSVASGRLLVVDWVPARPGVIDGLILIFDGGVLNADEVGRITVPADELSGYAFCTLDQARPRLTERNVRRVAAALRAREDGTVAYLDNGRPPG